MYVAATCIKDTISQNLKEKIQNLSKRKSLVAEIYMIRLMFNKHCRLVAVGAVVVVVAFIAAIKKPSLSACFCACVYVF